MAFGNMLVNDVPMQRNGFYSSNSALQRAAMLQALPMLSTAVAKMAANRTDSSKAPLTALEYGSADGNNSDLPMNAIVKSAPATSDVLLLLNDRPENDFTTLSCNIAAFQSFAENGRRIYAAMIPISFYERVTPAASVHIGFSLACLHHLDHVGPRPPNMSPVDPARQAVLREQAREDLRRFLNFRAEEIVPNGSLVLSLASQASTGEANFPGPVDACRAALTDMVNSGLISTKVAAEFDVPTYNRTMEDVRRSLDEVQGDWTIEEVCEKRILHPASEEFAARRKTHSENLDQHRSEYAGIVINWLMAVVAGYFDKMLKLGLGEEYREADAERLREEWIKRAKTHFLENHADEEVCCWFIYVRLRRVDGQ